MTKQEFWDWFQDNKIQFIVFVAVSLFYLIAGVSAGIAGLFIALGFLAFTGACIFLGKEMGSYTGNLPGPSITRTTPGPIISFFGWILLLVPFLFPIIGAIFDWSLNRGK